MGRMGIKALIATILQALGVLTMAGGISLICLWGGLIALGIGFTVFGIAIERND